MGIGGVKLQVILSHVNTDFDALASMVAAKKLYPDAQMVMTDKQNIPVSQFLAIYRDQLDFIQDNLIDWSSVTELILVDVASLTRTGDYARTIAPDQVKIIVYDHHPPHKSDVAKDGGTIEPIGAAVTLLIEEIRRKSIPMTSFEATLFGLGIYTDTGSFTYTNTTARDFQAASYLMEQGMNVELVQQFADENLHPEQQHIFSKLFQQSTTYEINGLSIVVSTYEQQDFQKGLATLTQKLLDMTDADAALVVVGMKKRVYVVGRARSNRINLLPLLKKWKGGGHEQAGSATIKKGDREAILQEVTSSLDQIIQQAITARDMMTSPVKTIRPETTIEEAGNLMYRYGHSGFPVALDGAIKGIITRRDLEKANHHGLGHAPVKAYMSTTVVSIGPETTEEEIQKVIIEHNIGRLPVVEDGTIVGIVSRTNIIEMIHKRTEGKEQASASASDKNVQQEMKDQLPATIYTLLQNMSQTANEARMPVYLIGGIVRDILLGKDNDDVDIVVEGDGVTFAKRLQEDYGGEVMVHESFGTATWMHPTGFEVDVTSSRLEYYDRPAALPDVEMSTLQEDVFRRDFTINAMAICLNEDRFGDVVDPFRGQHDLAEKRVRMLHNLSFIEDPTRILRGVRFETRFGFRMDDQTEKLALQSMERMKEVSVNRIVVEMAKLFSEEHPSEAMRRLFELQFWQQYGIDEQCARNSTRHAKQLQTLYGKMKLFTAPSWFAYFLIPFYEEGNMDVAKTFALTKRETALWQEVIRLQDVDTWEGLDDVGACHRQFKDVPDEAILFNISKRSLKNESIIMKYVHLRKQLQPLLTGRDLINEGLKPSALFTDLLMDHEIAVLRGELKTTDDARLWLRSRLERSE